MSEHASTLSNFLSHAKKMGISIGTARWALEELVKERSHLLSAIGTMIKTTADTERRAFKQGYYAGLADGGGFPEGVGRLVVPVISLGRHVDQIR